MKAIHRTELCDVVRKFQSTFISLISETLPIWTVAGWNFEDLTGREASEFRKVTATVGLTGMKIKYDTLVKNRIEKITDYDSDNWITAPRTWGIRIDAVEVQHEGESYVTIHYVSNTKPKIWYTYGGEKTELSPMEKSLLRKSFSKKQASFGLEKKAQIIHRDYKIASIKAMILNHETYVVI
jgi:hypothetical protein